MTSTIASSRTYEDTIKDIETTFGIVPDFAKSIPKDSLEQIWPILKKYGLGDSVIPKKYREMMALAAAAAMKCPYCQTFHKEAAKMLGATEEELNELALIVANTSFWSAVLHTQNYDLIKFGEELQAIGSHMMSESKK
jgi:AhpD family alkylhydroperoxidase